MTKVIDAGVKSLYGTGFVVDPLDSIFTTTNPEDRLMNTQILALALPTAVVHGFLSWGDADIGVAANGGGLCSRRGNGMHQPFERPDMGVADALNR